MDIPQPIQVNFIGFNEVRTIPKTGKIEQVHIQNGYSIPRRQIIVIFRRELWEKTLLHELLHLAGFANHFLPNEGLTEAHVEAAAYKLAGYASIPRNLVKSLQSRCPNPNVCKTITETNAYYYIVYADQLLKNKNGFIKDIPKII